MENCDSCNKPCKCKGIMSLVLAIAAGVGAYYAPGRWQMALGGLAVVMVIVSILSFMGKFSCKCCGESCAPKTAPKVAKKAAKKKKQ